MPGSSHPKKEAVVYQAVGLHAFSGGAREGLVVECYPLETAGFLGGSPAPAWPSSNLAPEAEGSTSLWAVGTHWFLAPTQRSLEIDRQEKNE